MKIANKSKIHKLNNDTLYQIGYFLLILNQVLSQSQYNEIELPSLLLKLSRWFLIFYFAFLILQKGKYPHNLKGMLWIFFAALILAEMLFFNGKLLLVILLMLVISSYKTNINSLIKCHISALILGVFLVTLSSWIGMLDVLGVYKQFDNITGFLFKKDNMRYAFGFTNSNIIPITCLYLYLYILLLKKNTYKWYYDIFALSINYIVFLFCGSRVCILLVFFAIGLRWLIILGKKRFIRVLVPGVLLVLSGSVIGSIILPGTSLYFTPVVSALDRILTARITIMRNVLNRFPITLFGYGEITVDNSMEYLVIDNGYLALFVNRGILIGFMFILILAAMILTTRKDNDPYLLLVLIIIIISNIVDNSILHYITFPIYVMAFNDKCSIVSTLPTELTFQRKS